MTTTHRCGWVAVMGPPNAGKSTITNALVGHKVAIVTPKPQTTRTRIVGILSEQDAQIIFMDTPGIHTLRSQTKGQLARLMSRSAWESLDAAHCILFVLDGDLYVRKPEYLEKDLKSLLTSLAEENRPVVVALNKVDLFHDKSRILPLMSTLSEMLPKAELFPLSALQKDGITELREILKRALPLGEAQYPEDQLSTTPIRFMAAEIIREKLFERLYQEVPYYVAVDIEQWEENEEQAIIHAVIYVAKSSHKAMVIGHAGEGIKATGISARKEIKALLDKRVHLELWVKVRDNWINDPNFLYESGFGSESRA